MSFIGPQSQHPAMQSRATRNFGEPLPQPRIIHTLTCDKCGHVKELVTMEYVFYRQSRLAGLYILCKQPGMYGETSCNGYMALGEYTYTGESK